MAIVRAVKYGNWSDPTVWNTGALPTSADDVYSNTFTVTIDVSPTVLSISNAAATGVTAGGSFVPTNGITLTCTGAGVIASLAVCINSTLATGASCTINANCTGGTGSASYAINNTSTGNVTVNGNVTGGTSNISSGINNAAAGTVFIVGNITSSPVNGSGTATPGVRNAAGGVINITGNVSGNTSVYPGLSNIGNGTINITGNVTGGSNGTAVENSSTGIINITGTVSGTSNLAISNSSTGTVTVTGSVYGGTVSAASNSSNGTLSVVGPIYASSFAAGIGAGSASQNTILTGPLVSTDGSTGAASGVNPCIALRWFPADTALGTFEYRMRGATVTGGIRPQRSLYLPNAYESTYPIAGDVRLSTTYGPANIYTGTLAVPPPGSVAFGVAVGATTGTAAIDVNSIASALASASAVTLNQPTNTLNTPGSIGERLKFASTVATTAQQLSDALSNE